MRGCNERDDTVYALDTRNATKPLLLKNIVVGAHPVALLFSPDQARLFVANSLSDTVSVIDTASNTVVGTSLTRPDTAARSAGGDPRQLGVLRRMERRST